MPQTKPQKPQKNKWPPFALLLAWYGQQGRNLPWRLPQNLSNPYAVWLAEIMLQQTTVATVVPYYERFLATWPTIEALANASLPQIYEQWAGLGYYSRARNVHLCAQIVATHGWPQTVQALQQLAGIGPYTAASVAAIAFGVPIVPVDGNVARILARVFADSTPLPKGLNHFRAIAATATVPVLESGNTVQALMDLGATICTPRAPKCHRCPWQKYCAAYQNNLVETLPVRVKKQPSPRLHTTSFVLLNKTGSHVLLQQQPSTGLLAGLWLPPMSDWQPPEQASLEAIDGAPIKTEWQKIAKNLVHIFTHKHLSVTIYKAQLQNDYLPNSPNMAWHKLADYKKWCTLTAKIIAAATAN
jgi:A/G-specific adenine glycosylase